MAIDKRQVSAFAPKVVAWQRKAGRHGLPWQVANPYAVWVSEVMLQQTQVATVLGYYPRFMAAFPDVAALAAAPEDEVLALWAGLGYYSRARNLHAAAGQVMAEFSGEFPRYRLDLERLKGVGRSTAAAIASLAYQQREAILDGNVKRVLCRAFALAGLPQDKAFERQLWALAEELLPENHADMPAYTQGLMDLGATVCTRSSPRCEVCPLAEDCLAKQEDKIAQLPLKKQAVAVKDVAFYWLIASNEKSEIWLAKRPNKGIWAGLYCVPEDTDWSELTRYMAAFGADEAEAKIGELFSHRLTHRRLLITPVAIRATHTPSGLAGFWARAEDWALPQALTLFLQGERG